METTIKDIQAVVANSGCLAIVQMGLQLNLRLWEDLFL